MKQETIGSHGAVSEAVAREMVLGALHQSVADLDGHQWEPFFLAPDAVPPQA